METPREALRQAFDEEMERDKNVYIIGEEVGLSGSITQTTVGLIEKYGYERVLDTPISEAGYTGLAIGSSYVGLRPIVEFMTWNFSLQAIDHIINSAAKTCYMSSSKVHCPIVFRGPSGFNPGYAAQHTQEFFAWYGSVPGLKVVAPYTAQEHKGLMKSAIRDDNPVVFLENELLYNEEFPGSLDDSCMPLDKARVLTAGGDITVIGISLSLHTIERAVCKTSASVEIINLISLNPIDYDTISSSIVKTGRLIIVDHSWPNYSVAHEITAAVYSKHESILKSKIFCLTGKDTHVGYSKTLEELFYPTVNELVDLIEKSVNEK